MSARSSPDRTISSISCRRARSRWSNAPATSRSSTGPTLYVFQIFLNWGKPPFDDVRVRKAFNFAIDREAFVKASLAGAAEPAYMNLPKAHWAYDKSVAELYPYDPGQGASAPGRGRLQGRDGDRDERLSGPGFRSAPGDPDRAVPQGRHRRALHQRAGCRSCRRVLRRRRRRAPRCSPRGPDGPIRA